MSKSLVAYFSASGVTKRLAERLADEIGADMFEIQPETPYTDADLDWQNRNSRSSIEMNDRSCRPAMRTKITDMAQYDVIFVGFPIWWYREPSIIDTFMESCDFSGNTVIPFATSGGSGMGSSGRNMAALAPDAKVSDGKCFPVSVSGKELSDWAAKWL